MNPLEHRIETELEDLQAQLSYALAQSPVYLPVVREIKREILICNCALKQLNYNRSAQRQA